MISSLKIMPQEQDEKWGLAKRFTFSIGAIPGFVSQTVRGIRNAQILFAARDPAALDKVVREISIRLFRSSPTYKVVLYFAAREIHAEVISSCEKISVKELMGLFTPDEICSIIPITYLSRKLSKKCEEQEWQELSQKLRAHMAIGRMIGNLNPQLGAGNGLLISAMRCLAFSILYTYDQKYLRSYKRILNNSGQLFDLQFEEETFGTNHLMVASHLLQNIGFGTQASAAFMHFRDAPETLEERTRSWCSSLQIIEELHLTGDPALSRTYQKVLKSGEEEQRELAFQLKEILENKDRFDWIGRSKDDLALALEDKLAVE